MDVVIDTSVVIAVIIGEPERDRIIGIVTDCRLIGPGSIKWEVGNAFSAMMKKGMLDLKTALNAVELFSRIPIQFIDPDFSRVLELCRSFRRYWTKRR